MNAFRRELLDLIGFTDYMATFADAGRVLLDVEPWSYIVDGEKKADGSAFAITSAAGAQFLTPMDGDCDFVMAYMSGFARNAASPAGATVMIPNPALLIQIQDLAAGRNFYAGPGATTTGVQTTSGLVPMAFVAGQGGFPFLLTSPRVIRARSTLQTTVLAAQPGTTFNGFYFAYHGARLWYG